MSLRQRLFGPNADELWRQVSEQIGAQFVDGGWCGGDKVVATHGPWSITLDRYHVHVGKIVVPMTRMRAPYVNPDGFRFTIYPASFFSGIATRLGMQDVVVGHEAFDREFVIKGTSEPYLRDLFANDRLRELLAGQPHIGLSVEDDEGYFGKEFPQGVDQLKAERSGVVTDVDQIKRLFELFTVTLDQLHRIGVATKLPPGVSH
jgi:hypothetical protein